MRQTTAAEYEALNPTMIATTAERLVLHRNTVQYRVRKAEEAVGRPIHDHRSDVELALRVCQVLGSTVLRAPRG